MMMNGLGSQIAALLRQRGGASRGSPFQMAGAPARPGMMPMMGGQRPTSMPNPFMGMAQQMPQQAKAPSVPGAMGSMGRFGGMRF